MAQPVNAKVVTHEDGSTSIGAMLDGVFVPFTTITAARAQQLIDRAKDLGEAERENGEDG